MNVARLILEEKKDLIYLKNQFKATHGNDNHHRYKKIAETIFEAANKFGDYQFKKKLISFKQ